MATIVVTDNADGTATVSITGGAGGDSHSVQAASWIPGIVAAEFEELDTRIGNGDVELTLDPGAWWIVVVSTSGGDQSVSNVAGVRVTSGESPLHWRCVQAIQEAILAASLPGMDGDAVVPMKLPWNVKPELPANAAKGIIVSPIGDPRTPRDNEGDDVAYVVQVAFLVNSKQRGLADSNWLAAMGWRNTLAKLWSESPLLIPEIHQVHVISGPVIDPNLFQANWDVGSLILQCMTYERAG